MTIRRCGALLTAVALLFPLPLHAHQAVVEPTRSVAPTAQVDEPIGGSLVALAALVSKDNCEARDAADGDAGNGTELPFIFCDDGLPPRGGGAAGIPVPVKYAANSKGNDWKGLPRPASEDEVAEADTEEDLQPESGNRITLDVDITLPPSRRAAKELGLDIPTMKRPRGGFPVIALMHGCCGGNKTGWEAATVDAAREQWHHSNAWWAARGYVVVTYTARGFRNSEDRGSTGTTQLDSRRYEINDYQYLIGLLADLDAERRAAGEKPVFGINPKRVAAIGGSYGGGFAWLALTDPTWRSPAFNVPMRLAAAVTKYGWTDLLESLVPSGRYRDTRSGDPTKTAVAPSKVASALSRPFGVEKLSIVSGLYGTGNNASGNHTTFPQYVHDAYLRLQQGEPYEGDALLEAVAESFLRDRSAYFQNSFWRRVKKGLEVPVYAAGTWTDPLFPTIETLRFYNKLKALNPDYPIAAYFGDFQHFTANKAKEWDDLCGDDHHVCAIDDYRNGDGALDFSVTPERVRKGINTRINEFLDHFLLGRRKSPRMNVAATTTICDANATETYPADEPGIEYRARTWRRLAPKARTFTWDSGGMVTSAALDSHAPDSDPVVRDRQTNKCFTTSETSPGPGVLHLESDPLSKEMTLLGLPVLKLDYDTSDSEYWISARLMDLAPDGSLTLVSRGVCKGNSSSVPEVSCDDFAMLGNAWVFGPDHRVVLEVSQSDTPFLRKINVPTSLTVNSAKVRLPIPPPERRKDFRS
ncbi:MAG: CocE/NonD family hydrolase [Actinomycetota bacterium]